MPVEIFTKAEFEDALPKKKDSDEPAWSCLGLVDEEYAYLIPVSVKNNVGIHVRSSVSRTGFSAECGEDSIRAWIVDMTDGKPMGGKISRWTTRQPGWQHRLWNPTHADPSKRGVLWQLRNMAAKIVPCPKCGKERVKVFKVKKEGPNHGRPFRTCKAGGEGCGFFEWLDEETPAKPQPKPCPDCGGKLHQGKNAVTCQGKDGEGCGHVERQQQEITVNIPVRLTVEWKDGKRVPSMILHVGDDEVTQLDDRIHDTFDLALETAVKKWGR
jgi:hypothetical protein